MAGRGPAPKDPEQRRRRNAPTAGEWVHLPPLEGRVLPAAGRGWSKRVKRLWAAWALDPVSATYTPSDVAAIYDLATVFEELKESEQRLRMEGLGLTPKGRQDRRFRVMSELPPAGQQDEQPPDGGFAGEKRPQGRRLKVVAPPEEAA